MFRCEQEAYGHIVLGSHDGIGSWTINLDLLPESSQRVVTQHEHAHHHLQSSSAWGMAMIASAVVDDAGVAADQTWIMLAQRCRDVHEMFATYVSATAIDEGLEHYRGNMVYLRYYGLATELINGLTLSQTGQRRAIEDLSRALMSPAWLAKLDFGQVRQLSALPEQCPDGPDTRLAALTQIIGAEKLTANFLAELFETADDSRDRWDPLAATLSGRGIDCPSLDELTEWTAAMVAGCNAYLPAPIEVTGRSSDALLSLVDNHSRERLRLHSQRLILDVGRAADHQPRPIAEFARDAAGVGPHVWLTWLPADFVARQFILAKPFSTPLILAILACDRRSPDPRAFLADFTPAHPTTVAEAVLATPVRPLFFTTVRALHHSSGDVDFRLWDPVLVLVDADVPTFVSHLHDMDESYVWSVLCIGGSRAIDFLLIRADTAPALTYLLPCSISASRILSAWLDSMTDTFRRSPESFIESHPWLRAPHRSSRWHLLCSGPIRCGHQLDGSGNATAETVRSQRSTAALISTTSDVTSRFRRSRD